MTIEKDKLAAQIRAARATLNALEADLDRAKVSRCSFTGQNGSRIAPVIGSRDAEALAVSAAALADSIVEGFADVVCGDAFYELEDTLASMMKKQIAECSDQDAPDYRMSESEKHFVFGVGGRA